MTSKAPPMVPKGYVESLGYLACSTCGAMVAPIEPCPTLHRDWHDEQEPRMSRWAAGV